MSDEPQQISIFLTKAQLTKLSKEQNIRVSHKALTGVNSTLEVSESMNKKIQAAIRKGKGIQIVASEVTAGAEVTAGSIGRAFRKAGHAIKKGVNIGAKYVHKNAGKWAEQVKKAVPKEMVQEMAQEAIKSGITAAAAMTGQPELLMAIPAAQKLGDKGVNAVYKHDFRKPLPTKAQAIKYVGKEALRAGKKYAEEQLNINFPDEMPTSGRAAMRQVGRAGRQYARDAYNDAVEQDDPNNDGFFFENYAGGSILSGLIAKAYNPVAKQVLDRYGDQVITKIEIVRTPLNSGLTTAINIASMGKYNKVAAKDASGKFYHLNANVTLQNGKVLTVEKTEVVTLKEGGTPTRGAEVMAASVPAGLTLRQMMDSTQRVQGSKFFTYSASSNNCQYFLRDLLTGNEMGTPALIAFAKQATEALFQGNAGLRKLANTATDLAAVANNITTNKYVAPYVPVAPSFKAPSKKTTFSSVMKHGLFGGSAMPLGGSARPLGGKMHSNVPRKGRFVKGSQEAKDHMAAIRQKRVSGGSARPLGRGFLSL